jgi:hypothetical protein
MPNRLTLRQTKKPFRLRGKAFLFDNQCFIIKQPCRIASPCHVGGQQQTAKIVNRFFIAIEIRISKTVAKVKLFNDRFK